YVLHWPAFCPDQPPEQRALFLETLSHVEASQTTAFVDEELTLRVHLDPALAPEQGRPLVLRVTRQGKGGQAKGAPIDLELFDAGRAAHADEQAGDGVYSCRHKFAEPGGYHVSLPGAAGPGGAPGETVNVAFEFRCPEKFGPIEYGGGQLQQWFQLSE